MPCCRGTNYLVNSFTCQLIVELSQMLCCRRADYLVSSFTFKLVSLLTCQLVN